MFNKIIKYIITLLLLIMIFCIIPKELNPITNIYIFVLLGLLVLYFALFCKDSRSRDFGNLGRYLVFINIFMRRFGIIQNLKLTKTYLL